MSLIVGGEKVDGPGEEELAGGKETCVFLDLALGLLI